MSLHTVGKQNHAQKLPRTIIVGTLRSHMSKGDGVLHNPAADEEVEASELCDDLLNLLIARLQDSNCKRSNLCRYLVRGDNVLRTTHLGDIVSA
jgi:hypothetical protein